MFLLLCLCGRLQSLLPSLHRPRVTLSPFERGCTRNTTLNKRCKFPFFYKGERHFDCTGRHIGAVIAFAHCLTMHCMAA